MKFKLRNTYEKLINKYYIILIFEIINKNYILCLFVLLIKKFKKLCKMRNRKYILKKFYNKQLINKININLFSQHF